MRDAYLTLLLGVLTVCWPAPANAVFFFFLPLGAIAEALETDPDKATYSAKDQHFAKCAGFHLNQAQGPADTASFHESMAQKAVEASEDKKQVTNVASAYSRRWAKAARVDAQTNRAYGADLGYSCAQVSLPRTHKEDLAMRARQEEERQRLAAEQAERLQAEAAKQAAAKAAAEAAAAQAAIVPAVSRTIGTSEAAVVQVDFNMEATKASRILRCTPLNLKVVGTEANNILYDVSCADGASLQLACDRTGLCLGR